MADIDLGRIVLDAEKAKADAAALKDQLGKLTQDSDVAKEAARRYAAAITAQASEQKKASDESKKLAEAQDDTARRAARATETFQRGFAGGGFVRDMRRMRDGLKAAGDESLTTGQRFQAFAGAAGIAMQAASILGAKVSQLVEKLVEMAEHVETTTRQYALLGASMDGVREVMGDQANVTQAFAAQNELLNHGFETTGRQLAYVMQATREYALRGHDAAGAAGALAAAIQSGDNVALAQFGVHIEGAMTATERWRVALGQLQAQSENGTHTATTLAEQLDHVKTVATEFAEALVGAAARIYATIASYTQVGQAIQLAFRAMESLTPSLRAFSGESTTAANHMAAQAAQQRDVAAAAHAAADGMRAFKTATNEASFAARQGETSVDALLRSLDATRDAARRAATARVNQRVVRRQLLTEARTGRAGFSARDVEGLTGGGGGANEIPRLQREVGEAREQIGFSRGQDFTEIQRRAHETLAHFLQREIDNYHAIAEQNAHAVELTQQQLQLEREKLDQAKQELQTKRESVREREKELAHERDDKRKTDFNDNNLGRQLQDSFGQLQTGAQRTASVIHDSMQLATSAVAQHISAWVNGRESFGQALQGMAHDAAESIAEMALPKALMEGAEAIASAASQNYGAAAQHAVAAAMFGAIAAGGFAISALTAPAPAASSSTVPTAASPETAARVGAGQGGAGGGSTVINVNYNGNVYSAEHASTAVSMMVRDAIRRDPRVLPFELRAA